MKLTLFACVMAACVATPAIAQTSPVPAPAATATAAKFDLETPIEDIVANPAAKAVLDKYFPEMATNANYDMFKSMSLSTLSQLSDKITPDKLEKANAELALIK